MDSSTLDSDKIRLTSRLKSEDTMSIPDSPPQELSPDEEDTKLLLKKSKNTEASSGMKTSEEAKAVKQTIKSSLISLPGGSGKPKLFDRNGGDKVKHSILQDSYDEESPPPSSKIKDGNAVETGNDLTFVESKASEFGFGSSTSDSPLVSKRNSHPGSEEKEKSEKNGEDFNIEEKQPEKKGKKADPQKTDKEMKVERLSGMETSQAESTASGVSFFSSSPATKYNTGDKAAETSLLQSPQRSDASSEDDTPFLNTSEEADNFLFPSIASDDNIGVCSKYSQLSEDGSTPSSPLASGKPIGEGGGGDDPKGGVFEHALELGVAFTEYVDVDSFKTSLGNKSPHTEDGFGGRSEEHLVALLQGKATKNLKSYLRTSQWPAESDARRNQWLNLCGHLLKAGGGLYQELAKDVVTSDDHLSLPPFVDREHTPGYFLNQHGVKACRGVMAVIAHVSPDIIYCPLLYPLAATFLHYMPAEACFDCLQALIASETPRYLAQARASNQAGPLVLRDLTKKYAKQAYNLIVRSSKSVDSVFEPWIWWIFKDLPFQYLVRILDSYMLEGYKVLYRMAIAILILFTKNISRQGNRNTPVTNIANAISRFCTTMPYEPRKVIKVGFGIRGLTRREILKLQSRHEAQIRSLSGQEAGEGEGKSVPAVGSALSLGQTSSAISYTGPSQVAGTKSEVLSPDMLLSIWSWIPVRLTIKKLELLFSSLEHGNALRTLYMRTQHAPQTLMAIRTTDGSIFGAFCSGAWIQRLEKNGPNMSFFGTGETFVFKMLPSAKKFGWTGEAGDPNLTSADHFMAGDDNMLIIGSGNGEAIYMDSMMNRCTSSHCDTFDNEPLSHAKDFCCQAVEVFGFVD